jgi:hypothetical protein
MNNIANCDITTGQCYPMGQGIVDYVPGVQSEIWIIGSSIFVAYCNSELDVILVSWDETSNQWKEFLTSAYYGFSPSQITAFNGSIASIYECSNGAKCNDGNIIRYSIVL